jgi:N-carbamoyl-L-amino-acid hydrolase
LGVVYYPADGIKMVVIKMEIKNLRVNGVRLRESLEEMAKIGATPNGGVQRLTLSDEDKRARDLFVRWLKEMDVEIRVDEMGNIFGKRRGKNNELAPVMSGSHIDSQPIWGLWVLWRY